MKRRLFFYAILLLFCKEALVAYTQIGSVVPQSEETVYFFSGTHFFVSILTGLVLAFAFQMLLTHLSIASGLSAITAEQPEQNPDFMDTERTWENSHRFSYGKSSYESELHENESTQRGAETIGGPSTTHTTPTRGSVTLGETRHTHESTTRGSATVGTPHYTAGENYPGATPFSETVSESTTMGNTIFVSNPYKAVRSETIPSETRSIDLGQAARTLTAKTGIWTVVTATLALFFASWLAVELSVAASLTAGAVLGLVIWGLYYICIVTFETSVFISMIGSLSHFASKSIQTLGNTGAALFTKTENLDWSQIQEQITKTVREETQQDLYKDELQRKIDRLLSRTPAHRIETVRNETLALFYDAAVSPEALLSRLRTLNRADFKNFLNRRSGLSNEESEKILWQLESARDAVIQRVESMKEEIGRRMEEIRRETIAAVEETRKTAASAAWWTFSAALSSGIAAVIGGMFAVITGS